MVVRWGGVRELGCEMSSEYRQDIRLQNVDELVNVSGIPAVIVLSSCFSKFRRV